MRAPEEKFKTVIEKNTFYFRNPEFDEQYESHLTAIKETLLVVKSTVKQNGGAKKVVFENLLFEKGHGLRALLALTGVSNEELKRLITIIRITNDPELNNLTNKDKWGETEDIDNLKEWSDTKIAKMIRGNEHFRKGIVNLFFEGSSVQYLADTLPLFQLKKMGISKLEFDTSEMIDTLIRYKEKGSRSGKMANNAETLIRESLEKLEIPFESGDLKSLVANAPDQKRTMDFIIPSQAEPKVLVESSFLETTSSGQGDKSKTEIAVSSLIKSAHPGVKFVGFVDGIGWYVRKSDLQRMVGAFDDVFTFHPDEMTRFENFLTETLSGG